MMVHSSATGSTICEDIEQCSLKGKPLQHFLLINQLHGAGPFGLFSLLKKKSSF
jgi:hypothetical protein